MEEGVLTGTDNLRIEGLVCVGPELPGGWYQTYVTGSKGVSHWESGKNV